MNDPRITEDPVFDAYRTVPMRVIWNREQPGKDLPFPDASRHQLFHGNNDDTRKMLRPVDAPLTIFTEPSLWRRVRAWIAQFFRPASEADTGIFEPSGIGVHALVESWARGAE